MPQTHAAGDANGRLSHLGIVAHGVAFTAQQTTANLKWLTVWATQRKVTTASSNARFDHMHTCNTLQLQTHLSKRLPLRLSAASSATEKPRFQHPNCHQAAAELSQMEGADQPETVSLEAVGQVQKRMPLEGVVQEPPEVVEGLARPLKPSMARKTLQIASWLAFVDAAG